MVAFSVVRPLHKMQTSGLYFLIDATPKKTIYGYTETGIMLILVLSLLVELFQTKGFHLSQQSASDYSSLSKINTLSNIILSDSRVKVVSQTESF